MAGEGALNSYGELADVLDLLPTLLREARRARRLNLRDAAAQIGISFNTVYRIEGGNECSLSNAVSVLRWLHHPAISSSKEPEADG